MTRVIGFAMLADTAPQEGGSSLLTPDGGLVIWTLVIFGLLMAILAKLVWPVILEAVREREQRLQDQLDEAAKANAEAQRVLTEYQQQVAAAKAEAQDIVAQARTAGDKLREDLVAKGRAEQEELLERARREIAIERDKALAELRREAVELSIAAASKVIERNLDTEADRKLVQEFLAAISSGRA
jgi:F-type H+-transporting ATPase subunit b